jgi:phosphatidylglycerophosphatase C
VAVAEKPVVAAFDFDGTITHRDTMFPFLRHAVGAAGFARAAILSTPVLSAYALGWMANDVAKARTLARFIGGRDLADLQEHGRSFARERLPRLVRPRALERLRWHQEQGHRCVIISASLDLYVEPWAASLEIDEVLCTRLQVNEAGCVSGALATPNCYGVEKLRRLERAFGPRGDYVLYAYGDSRGDRELLQAADYAWFRTMPGPRESV